MRNALLWVGAIFVSVLAPNVSAAQPYPTKPIRLISPFSPGGGTDILSRIIAIPMSESLGQTVVVDNRPGAGGAIGAEIAARAAPDGYTLILISSSYCATAAYRNLPYDPVTDIQPIILIGETGLVFVVPPSIPVKSVKELIDYARDNPGKLNYASVGSGSVAHLSLELFKLEAKVSLVHVPYKGGGPALNAVVAEEVQLTAISMVPTLPYVRAGRLRAIAITRAQRSALLPDVPTVSEAVPGYEVILWYGMWGPKGLPKDIVARWNKEVARILLTNEMKTQMKGEGLEPAAGPPEALRTSIKRDVELWRKVIKEANIKRGG
jgi:tripartite-type tricarboxylate transporter receptor subunit TctC